MESKNDSILTTVKVNRLRKLAGVFFAVIGIVCLIGCTKGSSNETPTNPTETAVHPTEEAKPTEEATPTVTPTPTATPIPEPKTLEQVEEDIKNIKVSIDDLMNEDVVNPTVFGAIDDNLLIEIGKRTAYFEQAGITYKAAKRFAIWMNYCYFNSDSVNREKAEKLISELGEGDALVYGLIQPIEYILKYNLEHPDNQIVISWGAIGDALGNDGRSVLNSMQQKITNKIQNGFSVREYEFMTSAEYNAKVTQKDGSVLQLTGPYDNLNIAVKLMEVAIICSGGNVNTLLHGYYTFDDRAAQYYYGLFDSILPAFEDPEHANARRHRFDANAYYEEDLDNDVSE